MSLTPITTDRVMALARKHEAYPLAGKVVTLRGQGIVEFAQALLAEALAPTRDVPLEMMDCGIAATGGDGGAV